MGAAVIGTLSTDRLARLPAAAEIHQGRRSVVEDLLSPVQKAAAGAGAVNAMMFIANNDLLTLSMGRRNW